jgi:hypothetical protein
VRFIKLAEFAPCVLGVAAAPFTKYIKLVAPSAPDHCIVMDVMPMMDVKFLGAPGAVVRERPVSEAVAPPEFVAEIPSI